MSVTPRPKRRASLGRQHPLRKVPTPRLNDRHDKESRENRHRGYNQVNRWTTSVSVPSGLAPPDRMSDEQIAAIVDALGGLLGLLRQADEHDRAEIDTRIGL